MLKNALRKTILFLLTILDKILSIFSMKCPNCKEAELEINSYDKLFCPKCGYYQNK